MAIYEVRSPALSTFIDVEAEGMMYGECTVALKDAKDMIVAVVYGAPA